jgi:C4-dicarboxylate-specific signal transduction histidine kinase
MERMAELAGMTKHFVRLKRRFKRHQTKIEALLERASCLVKYKNRGKRQRFHANPPTHSANEEEDLARSRC